MTWWLDWPLVCFMVRVLMISCPNLCHMIGHRFFGCAFPGQAAKLAEPGHPCFQSELHLWRELCWVIQRTSGNIQMVACDIVICKGCAAIAAETACHRVGTFE